MQISQELQKTIEETLENIWNTCKEAGITETSQILATLAVLLTDGKTAGWREDLRPTKPRNRYNIDADLKSHLQKLEGKIDGGTLFDRYLLFWDARTETTNSYPIPRHIVDCMVNLLDVVATHSFADFACGTGGFLVNSYRKNNLQHGATVGIDTSIDVIRLAVANIILHNIPAEHTQIYLGNALDLCATEPHLEKQRFDRIVAAPPFETVKEKELARNWVDTTGGNASESIFTHMALQKLNDQGIAALIVPLSLTSKSTRGMPALRQKLREEYTVRAVISLPDSALAPFKANSRVCILLIHNQRPVLEHQPWFFKVQKDGYPANLSRNLVVAPVQTPEENDLPFVENAIKLSFVDASPSELSATFLLYEDLGHVPNRLLRGVVLHVGTQMQLHTIRLFTRTRNDGPDNYLLITTSNESQKALYIVLPLTKQEPQKKDGWRFETGEEARTHLHKELGLKETEELPEGQRVYQDGFPGQKIAITQDGHLLGMTLPLSEIKAPDYWLQPERIIPLPEDQFSTLSPVRQISQLQQDHRLIANYVDSLLGQLEVKPIAGRDLPPSLLTSTHNELDQTLGPEQRALWEVIKQQKVTIEEKGKSYALYFVPDQFYDTNISSRSKLRVQQMLDLFVRMGLLVQVLVTVPGTATSSEKETEHRISCYRLVTEYDETEFPTEKVEA